MGRTECYALVDEHGGFGVHWYVLGGSVGSRGGSEIPGLSATAMVFTMTWSGRSVGIGASTTLGSPLFSLIRAFMVVAMMDSSSDGNFQCKD